MFIFGSICCAGPVRVFPLFSDAKIITFSVKMEFCKRFFNKNTKFILFVVLWWIISIRLVVLLEKCIVFGWCVAGCYQ